MRVTYTISPLLKPFRMIYMLMMTCALSAILFSLGNLAEGALGYYLFAIASLFLLTGLLALSARYAVEMDFSTTGFTAFVKVFWFRIGVKTTMPGQLEYVLLSTVTYTDNNTPVNAGDSYYTVYLVFDEVLKQEFIETTNKSNALRLASELSQKLALDLKDKTLKRHQ